MLLEPIAESFIHLLSDKKHQQLISKIARKYTRNTSLDWEDAVQAAQIKVLEAVKAGKFRQGGQDEFLRWATVVARYEIINLVKKERSRRCQSLDATIKGTNLSLIETITDGKDLFDTLARTDLILQAKRAIIKLDYRYPQRGYLKLWQGKVAGKIHTQLAKDLGVSQGEISKRLQELVRRVAIELGLLSLEELKHSPQGDKDLKQNRKRSETEW